jgi:AcrR family transcriptional regulator
MALALRRNKKFEARRREIVSAARRCFKKGGYHATSLKTIAAEMSLSPGTLYLYFKAKEDLYAAVVTTVFEELLVRLSGLNDQGLARTEDRILQMNRILLDSCSKEQDLFLKGFQILSQGGACGVSSDIMKALAQLLVKVKTVTAEIFATRGHGAHAVVDPLLAADIYWSAFLGVSLTENGKHSLYRTDIDIPSKLSLLFDIFTRGRMESAV